MTTTATRLKLPRDYADLDLKFAQALSTPVKERWPGKDVKFEKAEQPEAIGKVLGRSEFHPHSAGLHVAYLFRPEILTAGEPRISTTSAASAKLEFLTGLDFLLEFSHKVWVKLTPEQRIAAVDHALTAITHDLETDSYGIRPFDVEEFSQIVNRWGLWTPQLKGFGAALELAQIELFVPMTQMEEEPAARDAAEAERLRIAKGGR